MILEALAALAMSLGILACLLRVCGHPRAGERCFMASCMLACGAVAVRWAQVRRPPMQSLFEVFLLLAALVYPLSLFWRRVLRVPGAALDPLFGAALLLPAAFMLPTAPQRLPPALQSALFTPHVMSYVVAYVVLLKAACLAAASRPMTEILRLVRFGFPLLTLGLVLGAYWGKQAWGDYWNWDPKELWSLATWLVYAACLHTGALRGDGIAWQRALAVVGGAFILITLLWVNLAGRLFSGLHSYAT